MDKNEKRHQDERTLVIVKPDGVQRSLVGEIIKRFENVGLKIIGMKMTIPVKENIEKHYTFNPEWKRSVGEKAIDSYHKKGIKPPSENPDEVGDTVLKNLVKYLESGPVVVMVLNGAHAVDLVRKLVGSTEPLSSDVGTIRGDYVLDSYEMADDNKRAVRNLIHASGSIDEAEAEIKLWFHESELIKYKVIHDKILYDTHIDGILE